LAEGGLRPLFLLESALNHALIQGVTGQARRVVDVELGHEMRTVLLDGLDADPQFVGRLFVGLAFRDELEHLAFSGGERGLEVSRQRSGWLPFGEDAVKPGRDRRAEALLARADEADPAANFLGGGLLEDIPRGPRRERFPDIGIVRVGGQDEDPGGREGGDDLSGGFQPIHQRHGNVHDDDVRLEFLGEGDGFASIERAADYLEIGLKFQEGSDPLTDHLMIFGEQYGDSVHKRLGGWIERRDTTWEENALPSLSISSHILSFEARCPRKQLSKTLR